MGTVQALPNIEGKRVDWDDYQASWNSGPWYPNCCMLHVYGSSFSWLPYGIGKFNPDCGSFGLVSGRSQSQYTRPLCRRGFFSLFSFDAPSISSTSIANIVTSAGASVTV